MGCSDGLLDPCQLGFASRSLLKATELFRVKLQESRNNFLWPKDIICIIAGCSLQLVSPLSFFFTRLGITSWWGNGRHMGVFILSSFFLFLCLPFSSNLEAECVPFEEQLGCRSDYCSFSGCVIFPPVSFRQALKTLASCVTALYPCRIIGKK